MGGEIAIGGGVGLLIGIGIGFFLDRIMFTCQRLVSFEEKAI